MLDPRRQLLRLGERSSTVIGTGNTTGTPHALEVPVVNGGPSRTRTVDPLIKSRVQKHTQRAVEHRDVGNTEASAS